VGLFDMSMDVDLLASPQLYSLEYTVLCESPATNRSEFPVLTRILLLSKNFRILRLGCSSDSRYKVQDYQHLYTGFRTDGVGSLNMCLKSGDKFPSLEKLVFMPPGNRYWNQVYHLTRDHCIALNECIDWTKMKVVDLGQTASHIFFAELAGHIPNLKFLDFTILNFNVWHQNPSYVQSMTVESMESLANLEEFHMSNQSMQYFPRFWPIIQRHAATLRRLSMDVPEDQSGMVPVGELSHTSARSPFAGLGKSLRGLVKHPMNADAEQSHEQEIYDHSIRVRTESNFTLRSFSGPLPSSIPHFSEWAHFPTYALSTSP